MLRCRHLSCQTERLQNLQVSQHGPVKFSKFQVMNISQFWVQKYSTRHVNLLYQRRGRQFACPSRQFSLPRLYTSVILSLMVPLRSVGCKRRHFDIAGCVIDIIRCFDFRILSFNDHSALSKSTVCTRLI